MQYSALAARKAAATGSNTELQHLQGGPLMWIFTTRGFLSIVEDRQNTDRPMARARFQGDIQAIFGPMRVRRTPDADYR